MKKMKSAAAILGIAAISLLVSGTGITYGAGENIGSVVALKGSAFIERKLNERETRINEAKVKDGIQLQDAVETRESSKTKMLFIDDSVLTMGEKSKVVVREFIYSKDQKGRSIFNLMDGKMRSVVGKTEVEIHTPTVIAAARGTAFDCETGQRSGQSFTTCTCLEGVVDIRAIDPTITGRVSLRPGMTITVISGQPLPAPAVAPTSAVGGAVAGGAAGAGGAGALPLVTAPPVNMVSPKATTPNTGSIKVGW